MTDMFTKQIIASSLYYASEEMGIALRNSAYSPNIKERMDHSAALFDENGSLLAQAEHIPVHLGSLPWGLKNTLKYLSDHHIDLKEGDSVVVNNPYISGTHLNDVTVIRPIFYRDEIVAYSANKAHHSDIGGKLPGSINFDGRTIFEEGIILDPVFLMRNDRFNEDLISIFSSNSRNPYERIGDIKAQVAANYTGERRVLEIIERNGLDAFREARSYYLEYADQLARSRMSEIPHGTYTAEDYLEKPDGTDIRLRVTIRVSGDRIGVDYTGTDEQVDVPLNAVLGVTISGVYYVFRTLMGSDMPVNDGTFRFLDIHVPDRTVLNPVFPAPVSGGNVETSQRNADLIYLALSKAIPDRVPAASGGSMNNIMMGGFHNGRSWAFYETIGVGLGGKLGKDGTDGIHANMTNTMNTPIEEIERTMPLIMKRYEFRQNSAGLGKFRGGSGIVRSFMVSDGEIIVTVLSERERHRPWGLQGGLPGAPTEVRVFTRGRWRKGSTKATYYLKQGDIIEIRTAGGGGYGRPHDRDREKIEADIASGLITRGYIERTIRSVDHHNISPPE
ncbi:hypothetical protein DMB44_04490 [Thermoplasma sp. Kam2015]|uniref:hydantoinase B/oxoprolinase family protein n=1 Tax=Thermoplasma sp. Kam2015 TaxID=2094122 RepID=UPI000D90ED97|nr:hydantoinase B/oxoprolinase family protein [Thermoplasma sp. Kam2015]PYB68308.1 hypothetical protein DMB44_04490 [Thermoplasma sp. Kam2015]